MPRNAMPVKESFAEHALDGGEDRLSQNGQILGIAVYGGLLLVGFFFGIVTGYESPKPATTAKKENSRTQTEPPRLETPKPGITQSPPREPVTPEKKAELPPRVPKDDTAITPERKQDETPTPAPKNVDPPKPEPKNNTGAVPPPTIPKKKDPPMAVAAVSFEKQIKPILRSYCFNCHGAAGKPKGDVDLTSLAKILDPGNPPILKPGDPKKSVIFTAIEDMSMPPKGDRPGKQQLELIRIWILGGAKP